MAPKKVIALGSKDARRQARRQFGSLQERRVSAATLRHYQIRFATFLLWLHASVHMPANMFNLDHPLAEYIEYLWNEGEPKAWANYTVAAVQFFLTHSRRHLNLSWSLVKVWGKIEMPAQAPPCTPSIALGLSGLAALAERLDLAVILLLGFHCILRTAEMVGLRCGDIFIDHKLWRGVINLGFTKTGKRRGAVESVTIDDALIAKLTFRLIRGRPPGQLILSSGPPRFRADFKARCNALNLGDFDFKPYSIRRGGATAHLQAFGSMSLTCDRGRWAFERSARVYIQTGLAQLAHVRLSTGQEAALLKAARHFAALASQG